MKNKPDLSALKHADMQTIERIAEHGPAAGQHELDKIYASSERKYLGQLADNGIMTDSELFEVAVERRSPVWKRTWAAAACLLVCAGTVGGMYALNRHLVPEDHLTAEVDSIAENADQTVSPKEDEQSQLEVPEIVHDGQSASPVKEKADSKQADTVQIEDASQDAAEQETATQKAGTASGRQKASAKSNVKSSSAPSETTPQEEPTEAAPEENIVYKTALSGVTFGKTYSSLEDVPEIPGFNVEALYNDNWNHSNCWCITPSNLDGAAERIVTGLIPTYVPDYLTVRKDASFSDQMSLYYNKENGISQYAYETHMESSEPDMAVSVTQRVKRQTEERVYFIDDGEVGEVTPVTIDGRSGYITKVIYNEYRTDLKLRLDAGDFLYIAWGINIPDDCLDDMILMLRSMQPRDTSNDPVATNLPEIPGFTVGSEWWYDGEEQIFTITAGSAAGAPETIQTKYAVTYMPEGIYADTEGWQPAYDERFADHLQYGLNYYNWTAFSSERNPEGGWMYGSTITMMQTVKKEFFSYTFHDRNTTVTPLTVGGKPAFLKAYTYITGGNTCTRYKLFWDQDDYIFSIELMEYPESARFKENWLDEIVRMAESVQPIY